MKKNTIGLGMVVALLAIVQKIIDEIFEGEEIKEKIRKIESKKIRFFLKRELTEEIVDKVVETLREINEKNRKIDRRRSLPQRREVEKKIANNPAFISTNERIHDEIRKRVEEKLNKIISQKS